MMQLKKLMETAYENDDSICRLVAEIVPTYHPDLGGTTQKDDTYKSLYRETVGAK